MNLLFKKPSLETKIAKSKIALGENIFDESPEEIAISKIKKVTGHEFSHLTNSGNNSIFLALSQVKGDIIIPDQGGWNGFKQIARLLNKNIHTLKTDLGIINPEDISDLELSHKSAIIFTSFAGYTAEQDIKAISTYCHDNAITVIEDCSGGICDNEKKLGNGKLSDILIASTGSPKMINVGNGGFISYNNPKIFDEIKIPLKISKCDDITACGIATEIDFTHNNFKETVKASEYLKNNLENVIHQEKRGLNVIIKSNNPKKLSFNLKNELPLDEKSFFTKCPNYNRVKEKAVAIELKNLEISSLIKENLDIIIEKVNDYYGS